MDGQRQSTSIFWDASAGPAPGISGSQIVKALENFAATLGLITAFRLYADLDDRSGLSTTFRSEVQGAGVTLVDTASQGRMGAASKMIIGEPICEPFSNYL